MRKQYAFVGLLFSLPSLTPALAGSVDYTKAFARPGGEHPVETVAADATPATGEDAMDALRQLGSFPVRVHTGDDNSQGGWPSSPLRDYAPKRLERPVKVGRCAFIIRTGDFTVRRYERGGDRLNVSRDSVERLTTLVPNDDEPVMVSVNADLYVSVQPAEKAACKQMFGGRRVKIGAVDLGQTVLRAQDQSGGDAALQAVASPRQTDVYLAWDVRRDSLVLEDMSGMAPAVESAVYSVAPRTAGDYYLAVTPQLDLKQRGASGDQR